MTFEIALSQLKIYSFSAHALWVPVMFEGAYQNMIVGEGKWYKKNNSFKQYHNGSKPHLYGILTPIRPFYIIIQVTVQAGKDSTPLQCVNTLEGHLGPCNRTHQRNVNWRYCLETISRSVKRFSTCTSFLSWSNESLLVFIICRKYEPITKVLNYILNKGFL